MTVMGWWRGVRRPIVVIALVLANVGLAQLVGVPHTGAADVDLLSQTFDGVTAPAVPTGWTASRVTGGSGDPTWRTVTQFVSSAPNAARVEAANHVTDMRLDSPAFVSRPGARVSFNHRFILEDSGAGRGNDGGVFEIKIGTGSFVDFITAGGSWQQDGYNQTIGSGTSSPIAGRGAFSGDSLIQFTTVGRLPDSANGHSVQLRWRLGTDSSVGGAGFWAVDNVRVATPAVTVTINRAADQPSTTSSPTIRFTAIFSEAVTGFSGDDISYMFRPDVTAPGALSAVVEGSGTTWTVVVSGMTGSGTVEPYILPGRVSFPNDHSTSTDNVVTYVHRTVTIDEQAGPDPRTELPIPFAVRLNAPVTGFDHNDVVITVTPAGPYSVQVTGSSRDYTVLVSGLDMTRPSTVKAFIPADVVDGGNSASTSTDDTARFQPPADVSVSQTDSPDPVTPGGNITYTVRVQNTVMGSTAQDVKLVDPIPLDTSYVSRTIPSGWTCDDQASGSSDPLVCERFTWPQAAAPQDFTLVVRASSFAGGGTITNTATVSALGDLAASGNNVATTTTGVRLAVPDVGVTKTGPSEPVLHGSNVTYTIGVRNTVQDSTATSVSLSDPVPTNTTFVSRSVPSGWTCDPQAVGSTTALTCTRATLPFASTFQDFTLVVKVNASTPAGTTVTNTVTVSAAGDTGAGGNNVAQARTTVISDVSVTKSASPDSVLAGGKITYTIKVANTVAGSTATSLSLSDPLPANTTFVSRSVPSGWACNAQAVGSTTALTCTRATLVAAPTTQDFTLVVKVNAGTTVGIVNMATVSATGDTAQFGNNQATAVTPVVPPGPQADVSVTKTGKPGSLLDGDNITYSIRVQNSVVGSTAANVTLNDPIPANTTFVSRTVPGGWNCVDQVGGSTTALSCDRPALTPGDGFQDFTLVVKVTSSTPGGTTITNTATVSAAGDSGTSGNNVSTATSNTVTRPQADVDVHKDAPPEAFPLNQITYGVTVRNLVDRSIATNVAVRDNLPADTRFVRRVVPSGWGCDPQAFGSTDPLVCRRATLTLDDAAAIFEITVQISGSVGGGATIVNTAQVTADGDVALLGNNVSSATTTILGPPAQADVSVTKTDIPEPVVAGSNITYTITVANSVAGSTAASVSLTDNIPAHTTFVSRVVPTGWDCSSPTLLSCTRATLTPTDGGQVFTLVVKVKLQIPAATPVTNTATVSATGDTATSGNNLATTSTAVTFAASRPAVVRGSTNWLLRNSLTTGAVDSTFTYGAKPLTPIFGDWDGNGSRTAGTFEGGVFKLNNANDSSAADVTFTFGDPRGFPVAGDFNGDGTDDVAVFRAGVWQVHHLGTGVPVDATFSFGPALSWPAVVPLAGDWNGDGTDGIGVYNLQSPVAPLGQWNLRQTASGTGATQTVTYGGSGLYPIVGDWNGDGIDSLGTKVMAGTGWALSNSNTTPSTTTTFDFGLANDLPSGWR